MNLRSGSLLVTRDPSADFVAGAARAPSAGRPCAAPRQRPLRAAVLLPLLALLACNPMGQMVSGGDGEDLAPVAADMAGGVVCGAVVANLLRNPSFEMDVLPGDYSARNIGNPPSTISGPWDACCNTNAQGLTTTFKVDASAACSGRQAISITSTAAQDDVLNQEMMIASAASKMFTVQAYVRVLTAGAGASLSVDLYDLNAPANLKVLARTTPLTAPTAGTTFTLITAAGVLPATSPARVQARIRVSGTLTALIDDVGVVLK